MGRGVVSSMGGWGGGGGVAGSERPLLPPLPPLLLFPPPVPFLLTVVLSAMAVLAVAVPLAEGPPTEERPPEGLGGCVYGGSEYAEGEAVATEEQCLNCTCSRGALICHLRACPPVPKTPGCKAVRRGSHACCPSIVCDDVGESERSLDEETIVTVNVTTNGCDVDGHHHEEGSDVPAKAGRCENCICAQGKVKCALTPCSPAPIGCTPLYSHGGGCCPSRYDCSSAPSLSLPETKNGVRFESLISALASEGVHSTNEPKDERGGEEDPSGVTHDQVTQISKSSVDGRKNRHMDETQTEDGVQPSTPSAHDDEEEVAEGSGSGATKEEEDGTEGPSATTTEQTATETEDGALTSDATTELSIENTKTEVIDEATTTAEITTWFATEESCPPGGGRCGEGKEEATTEGTTATEEEAETTTTSVTTTYVVDEGTTEGVEDTETTTTTQEETTLDPQTYGETTQESSEGTTIRATLETGAAAEGNASSDSDKMKESIDAEGNSTSSVDAGEKGGGEELSQKNSHLVDIGAAQDIDSEVQVNQSSVSEKEESTTMSSEKTANQSIGEDEAEVLKVEKANSTEGAVMETTSSPLGNSITTVLSIDRKKDVDYDDYDYNEPSLPPSLPNLKIIPFVAADAVVDNDNHKTTENSIFFDGAPPSLFSPPVETEGGFVPREPPLLHEVTYQSPLLSDVLSPIHTDVGLAGIAAIEITTTSKTNVQGNFGQQNNPVNVTGVLDPFLEMNEKPTYTHVTDIRPAILDNKLSPILPMPSNFTLQNASTSSMMSSENMKIITATAGSVSTTQISSSTSSGHLEMPRPPYSSDRVSEIPFGPTPPRPSPSTSPSYSVGPNMPPEKSMPSALSMAPPRPQNPPPVGLLKLAGCNIYGRMYRVGRIISELSGPCLECRCTEVGVQCRPLPC